MITLLALRIVIILLLINIMIDNDRRNATKSPYYDPNKIKRG
jgi:hypothetical protein